ncbi:MAG TPA: hypothetical protein VMZ26_00535 [Pyrinomonadaceae bacterium]|nr:hypothetical protein [Pyrinomonadaceae bacterium]
MDEAVMRAAFEATVNFFDRHAEAKADLQNRFPSLDYRTVSEAYLAACKLREIAYSVAEKHRDGIYSIEAALLALRTECPGFPAQVYMEPFNRGSFESR